VAVVQGLVRSTSSAVSGRTIGSRRGQVGGSSEAAVTADVRLALDVGRTSRLVGFSALVGTPVAFVWFGLLDQVRKRPGRGLLHKEGC
jgi:hypothetical protein